MSGMNPTLAAMYNTHGAGTAARKEQVKVAHLSLFAKSAAANNIDLTQLDANTRNALYREFSTKLAEEGGPAALEDEAEEEEEAAEEDENAAEHEEEAAEKHEEAAEKKEDAEKEEAKEAYAQFLGMKHWQQKVAESDYLGRVMAHSYTDERAKIAAAGKTAGTLPPALAANAAKMKEKKSMGGPPMGGEAEAAEQPKQASTFDIHAARQAVKIASSANMNTTEVVQRLNALLTLGVPAMNKTAAALEDYGQALNTRGLELLEAAGYPIDWTQVFGK